jgi:cobaltochelatase CobS
MDLSRIECKECGKREHVLAVHIIKEHGLSVEEYQAKYAGAPVLSAFAAAQLKELEEQAHNDLTEVDIRKTFGAALGPAVKTIPAYKNPHPTTPALDPDYVFRKELLKVMAFAFVNNQGGETKEFVLYSGPTGSGKSSVVEQFMARVNWPFYRINMDSDIGRADFIGQWVLRGEETIFQYGILPRAMREGAALLIDEWDCMNPSIGMVLQAVLEGKPLVITETGEILKPANGFMIFATSNTLGQGDSSGLYNGTQLQNFAALDRFDACVIVDYAKKAEEKAILQKKLGFTNDGLSAKYGVKIIPGKDDADQLLEKTLEVARLVREAFVKEEITATMSTRTLVNVLKKLVSFGDVRTAYNLAYVNKLTMDNKKFVNEIIQRVWGV